MIEDNKRKQLITRDLGIKYLRVEAGFYFGIVTVQFLRARCAVECVESAVVAVVDKSMSKVFNNLSRWSKEVQARAQETASTMSE